VTCVSDATAIRSSGLCPAPPTPRPRAGVYRLRHFGDYKHILGGTQAFEGASRSFCVALGAGSCLLRRAGLAARLALRASRLWQA